MRRLTKPKMSCDALLSMAPPLIKAGGQELYYKTTMVQSFLLSFRLDFHVLITLLYTRHSLSARLCLRDGNSNTSSIRGLQARHQQVNG